MSTYTSCEVRYDAKALREHLLAIGLVPGSRKWTEVAMRKAKRFLLR